MPDDMGMGMKWRTETAPVMDWASYLAAAALYEKELEGSIECDTQSDGDKP